MTWVAETGASGYLALVSSPEGTVPDQAPRLPVRSIRVDVIDGADVGLRKEAASDSMTLGSADGNDVVLADPTVSRYHAQFTRAADGVRIIDNGSTNGTFIGNVRVERAVVPPGTVVRLGRVSLRIGDGDAVDVPLHGADRLGGLLGQTPVMRRLMAGVERAAESTAAVLLVGESGTGKEVVARVLHELSPRSAMPFVTVDCGALSPTLIASELFGHEKGAFTGAERQHVGAFERAHGGTLFLDEIGELPAALQANLLGVLERRKFRRLGGRTDIAVDIRVVGATHRDLRAEVNRGTFRLDLFYRLAVVVLTIPSLRDRTDDIPMLVEHFLRETGQTGPVDDYFSEAAMNVLRTHLWPGNVRELKNLVEATIAMGEPPPLEASAQGVTTSDPIGSLLALPYGSARSALLQEFESRYLQKLLERTSGNVSRASREARMDRSHLIDLLRRHSLR